MREPEPSKIPIDLLVTDLDNTLYDWVSSFVEAFYAMVEVASKKLSISEDALAEELQAVHKLHHNSEHPFALLETKTALQLYPHLSRRQLKAELQEAFDAFNSRRRAALVLYDGVVETLAHIRACGVPIVAHTEATVPNAQFRLRSLGIEQFFTALYAPAGSGAGHPEPEREKEYAETSLLIRRLPVGERKPSPRVLLDICRDLNVDPSRTLYVGDSVSRDVGMALAAGVHGAWAKYGTNYDPGYWAKLVKVTHWTEEDVLHARLVQEQFGGVQPTCVLDESISELLSYFSFGGGQAEGFNDNE
jgi:phosphoglycolate phosphatase